MMLRILASVVLLFSILFLPFWVSIILALAGMIYFRFFLEAVFMFLLSDLLYGVKEAKFFNIVFISLIVYALVLTGVEFVKRRLKFYPYDSKNI